MNEKGLNGATGLESGGLEPAQSATAGSVLSELLSRAVLQALLATVRGKFPLHFPPNQTL